jgi:2-amino-4-hydroxy-6-hydroxymethyldihydropteridine diphosphokinase
MILIAIGANLPGLHGQEPLRSCLDAVAALRHVDGVNVRAMSRWYESAAFPPSGQPPYVNGVVRLEGQIEPGDLLARLQFIESLAGRTRGAPNAARTLDLDVIDVDGLVRDAPDPVLPHPRAHERAFVLLPLADVAPGWVHPRLHCTVEALLAALGRQQILAIEPDHS